MWFSPQPLSHGGGDVEGCDRVGLSIVSCLLGCLLICQIRRLLEEKAMGNQRVLSPLENLLKKKRVSRV